MVPTTDKKLNFATEPKTDMLTMLLTVVLFNDPWHQSFTSFVEQTSFDSLETCEDKWA